MDAPKSSVPARTPKDPAPRLPDHELIRLDAAAHPDWTYSEHVEAARVIAGRGKELVGILWGGAGEP